ncbi:hypothetical protein NEOLEDRAFT_1141238 [Neolentinus lepideus HHB14362 ss-1]|uniref:Uncharacterized protein n=1 Tax=Neolentinus lepideus HHB14362 ss-1 TaxID=1314782 RepID=A0A165NSC8_9AGAM|nr:hypothetical protein NEOLEDRAFT_1141238 [Neolentinus lepideus HHB14362 ss-1]
MPSELPWDKLKAETLRSLCRDLDLPPRLGRRDEMIKALIAVGEEGLDSVLERIDEIVPDENSASSARRAKRPRKSEPEGTLLSDRKKGMELRSGLRADGSLLKKRQKTFDGVVIETAKTDAKAPAPSAKRRRVTKSWRKRKSAAKIVTEQGEIDEDGAHDEEDVRDEEDVDIADGDGDEDAAESNARAGASASNVSYVPVSFAALADEDADRESEGADPEASQPPSVTNAYIVNGVVVNEIVNMA